jgi:Response regulator receiver domain
LDDLKLVKHASRSLAAVAMRRAGQTFVLLGDDRKAEEVLNRSIDFEDAAATHLDLCAAYLAAKKPSDCLTETGKVILRDPQNAAARRIQSEAWKMEGDSAHAESSRKQADSLPDNPQDLPDPLIVATLLSPAQRTKLKAEQSDLAKIIANALNDLGTTEARESNFPLALTHSVRELVRAILTARGYNVLVAESASHASALCQKHQSIDLFLTDVVMPEVTGPRAGKETPRTSSGNESHLYDRLRR